MRFLPLLLLLAAAPLAQAQQRPTSKRATTTTKPAANSTTRATGDATVAPGETVELGRASTDYNGRPSTYKKPSRALPPTDKPVLPGGQGLSAAPGQPVQPAERARDDYEGRPVKQPAKTTRPATAPKPTTH